MVGIGTIRSKHLSNNSDKCAIIEGADADDRPGVRVLFSDVMYGVLRKGVENDE